MLFFTIPYDIEAVVKNESSLTGYENNVLSFCIVNGKLYAGIYAKGLYVSSDGDTFAQNTSFPVNKTPMSIFLYDEKMFVGTGNYGIYVSSDGDTFAQFEGFDTSYTVSVISSYENELYVGTSQHGLYVSLTENSPFIDELDKRFSSGESIPLDTVEAMFD